MTPIEIGLIGFASGVGFSLVMKILSYVCC